MIQLLYVASMITMLIFLFKKFNVFAALQTKVDYGMESGKTSSANSSVQSPALSASIDKDGEIGHQKRRSMKDLKEESRESPLPMHLISDAISRVTLCVLVTLVSTILFLATLVCVLLFEIRYDLGSLVFLSGILDGMINVVCLIMQWPFGICIYQKLCGKCDLVLQNMCKV